MTVLQEENTASSFPLTKANRLKLALAFRSVPRIDIAIDCAIEGQMGEALVDTLSGPTAFAIRIGPFCYLAGDPEGGGARHLLRSLAAPMMIMAAGPGWAEVARDVFGGRLSTYDRFSFSSAQLSLDHLRLLVEASPWREHVVPMGIEVALEVWPNPEVADLTSFDSPEDFAERGIGYCVQDGGVTVGAAYSSLVCSNAIEVSVVVDRDRRKQGMATALSAALLSDCLTRQLRPNWDAANEPSCRLAEKLGYVPTGSYLEYYVAA